MSFNNLHFNTRLQMATKRTVKIKLTKTTGFNGALYFVKVYHNGAFQDQISSRNYLEAREIYLNAVENAATICTDEPLESYTVEA